MRLKKIFYGLGKKKTGLIMICIFLSFMLWMLTKLSNTYREDLKIFVQYTNIPPDMYLDKSFKNTIKVRVEGTGFSLLKHNLSKDKIVVNLKQLIHVKENTYQFPKDMNQFLIFQDFKNLIVKRILTDTVQIDLQRRISKKVPIVFHSNVSYRVEYQLTDMIIKPDSITVTGYRKMIDTLTGIYLKGEKLTNINDSFEQTFPLKENGGIRYSDSLVRIQGIVSKMSEKVIKVPIMIRHTPDTIDLKLFPAEIELVCSGSISRLKTIKPSDLQIFADYHDRDEQGGYIPLKIVSYPKKIRVNFLSDKKVEYLIRKK